MSKSKNKARYSLDPSNPNMEGLIVEFKHMNPTAIDFLSGLSDVDIEVQEIAARKLIAAGFVEEAREILRMTRAEYEDFVCNTLDGDDHEN